MSNGVAMSTGEKQLKVPSSLVRLSKRLSRQSRAALWLLALVLLAAVSAVDAATGSRLSVSLLYVIPIALAAWHLGWRPAVLVSIACVLAAVAAASVSDRAVMTTVAGWWNAAVVLGFHVLIAYLITLFRQGVARERALARTDALTKLPNRRGFGEMAERELARAHRRDLPMTIACVDVDAFRTVIERRGHDGGDELLCHLAQVLRVGTRDVDIVARFGGDEFVVLLPEVDASGAPRIVTRLLDSLEEMVDAGDWQVRFSAGIVSYAQAPPTIEEMVQRADRLMVHVKEKGGNRAGYLEVAPS